MNRYVVDGILADMRAGRRVLVVAQTVRMARFAFNEVAAAAVEGETVRRANGRERITHPDGGWIRFCSVSGHGARGLAADVVFIDADPTMEQLAELVPVAASGGEVFRA